MQNDHRCRREISVPICFFNLRSSVGYTSDILYIKHYNKEINIGMVTMLKI